jgi:pectin methylesterase-like acyl-CoA thioesterase
MIKKIETQSRITRANAYSFAGILKHHRELGYVIVNSMFCALADYT